MAGKEVGPLQLPSTVTAQRDWDSESSDPLGVCQSGPEHAPWGWGTWTLLVLPLLLLARLSPAGIVL